MDFIVVIIILIIGYNLAKNHKLKSNLLSNIALPLYFYHLFFSIVYYFYILTYGGDALGYWMAPKELNLTTLFSRMQIFLHASDVLYTINYFPSAILNLSFFSGSIIYGFLGYIGILHLIKSIEIALPYIDGLKNYKILGIKILPLLFFIPNFHFWSSGVGKDTLSFLCICLFIYAIMNPVKNWFLLFIAIGITYLIRPHITLFLASSFIGSLVLLSKMPLFQKVMIIAIALIGFFPLLDNVLEFANIEDTTIESFTEFSDQRASSLSRDAGSAVDISNLPYPLKVLTFLYRPFFFDSGNILGVVSSFENLLWVILTIKFFRNKPLKTIKSNHFIVMGSFLYWLVGALAFAPVMSNLGIIVRERNMFLPAFFIFVFGSLSTRKEYYLYSYKYKLLKKKYINDNN